MDSIAALREELLAALSDADADVQAQLFDELAVARPILLNVLNFGGRNAEEMREVQSGRVTINNRSLAVNSEFAKQVAFLSSHLNLSERLTASLLHSVASSHPTIDPIDAIEQTVLVYHRLRRDVTDCLRYLAESASIGVEGGDAASGLHYSLNEFVRKQMVDGSGGLRLGEKVFREIVGLGNQIQATKAAVTNAVSNTRLPCAQAGNGSLGANVLQGRLESLLYEQRNLAFSIYFLARAGYLLSPELKAIVAHLQTTPRNEMTLYMLSSVLAAFDLSHSPPSSQGAESRGNLIADATFVSFAKKAFGGSDKGEWNDRSMKAVLGLRWTLFMTESRHRNNALERVEGFTNEDLAMQIYNSIQGDAFVFLSRSVRDLSENTSVASQLLAMNISRLPPPNANEQIGENGSAIRSKFKEFKPYFLHEVELLLRTLLTHAPSELRKIKHKQEDQFRPRADHRHLEPEIESYPRNDIATLFQLLGALYESLPPDSASQFWGLSNPSVSSTPIYYEGVESSLGKLPSFLRWAVEVREPELIISVFDMLSGLSNGTGCAECAYNFLASGSLDVVHGAGASLDVDSRRYDLTTVFTWRSVFSELDSWSALGSGPQNSQQPRVGSGPPPQLPIAPTDVLLGLAFLKLTAAIASNSVQARIAVATHPQYRAIHCLVSLIPLGVPLELKGAIFETLAAFCQPCFSAVPAAVAGTGSQGVQGVDICRNVWAQMERLEVINVRSVQTLGLASSKGVEAELEEVESVHRVYPATIPFLELLATLIHTPKRASLKSRLGVSGSGGEGMVGSQEPINTIPENLGTPYRTPGIGPFVSFVVDNVLAKLTRREYLNPGDMWTMADLSLSFVERCLASYDLESLPSLANEYNARGVEALTPFVQHPGFEVIARLLGGVRTTGGGDTSLRTTVLRYAVEGADELPRQSSNSRFGKTILRSLRIIERVLQIQDIFLDTLVPALSSDSNMSQFNFGVGGSTTISSSFLSRLDQELSLDQRSIPALGSYVAYGRTAQPELTHLAIKILSLLSSSPSFTNIAALIERSSESNVILNGFVQLLKSDSDGGLGVEEDVGDAEEWADLWTGAGAPDMEEEGDEGILFGQATRLCIIDLLLKGVKHSRSGATNLAFLLLFGKSTPDQTQIQDPHALGSRESCLHVILDSLNAGIPRTGSGNFEKRQSTSNCVPLFHSQPVLAERLYKLIFHLCEHSRTSAPMLLYLRTRENFFARHLAAMAMLAPIDLRMPNIEVQYNDGSRLTTTTSSMRAFLLLRSWLTDLVSLELHALTSSPKNYHSRIKELLDLLFGTTDATDLEFEIEQMVPFNDISQSRIRLIELFQSLHFEWFDSLSASLNPIPLSFYANVDLQSCLSTDADGCEVVDRALLFDMLGNARRALMREGKVGAMVANSALTKESLRQVEAETRYILESCVVENHRREVSYALGKAYESWKKLCEVVLGKCFDRVSTDQKENILFDLLHVLPPTIRDAALPETSAMLLSEVLLQLITKLREERARMDALGMGENSALPVERISTLLRHMLDCILDKQRHELVRGNIYAALVNLFRLVMQSSTPSLSRQPPSRADSSTLLSNLTSSMTLSRANSSGKLISSSSSTSLEHAVSLMLKQHMDKLVSTIARDAIDGSEVWKTIAFTLLECLVHFSSSSLFSQSSGSISTGNSIITSLSRYALLSSFVSSLRDASPILLDLLETSDGGDTDLNPLYVYEAKMSFLVRVAQGRVGAGKLLEERILFVLGHATWLDARPEGEDSANIMDDGFLPSASTRYHELLVPALHLVSSIIATLGVSHIQASKQTIDFIYAHRDIFAILLKQDFSTLSISLVEELDLLVSLCAMIVPAVPQSDLFATNTGFGSLHNAILSLAAKVLSNTRWAKVVQPSNESEAFEARSQNNAMEPSKFELRVQQSSSKLQKSLLGYLSAIISISETDSIIVLSPLSATRLEDRQRGLSAPIPSIRDCVDTLDVICERLFEEMQVISDAVMSLENKEQLRVDGIEDLIGSDIDPQEARKMDVAQRRAIVCQILRKRVSRSRMGLNTNLASIEMLLHLIWHHISYYISNNVLASIPGRQRPFSTSSAFAHSQSPAMGPNLAQSHLKSSTLRYLAIPNVSSFRTDASLMVSRVVKKLEDIELNEHIAGRGWRANQTYLEIMTRCLRELTLGDGDLEEDENDSR